MVYTQDERCCSSMQSILHCVLESVCCRSIVTVCCRRHCIGANPLTIDRGCVCVLQMAFPWWGPSRLLEPSPAPPAPAPRPHQTTPTAAAAAAAPRATAQPLAWRVARRGRRRSAAQQGRQLQQRRARLAAVGGMAGEGRWAPQTISRLRCCALPAPMGLRWIGGPWGPSCMKWSWVSGVGLAGGERGMRWRAG